LTEPDPQIQLILTALSGLMLTLVAAHIVARQAIAALGTRLGKLEDELKFGRFETSAPLESALKVTLAASIGGFFLMLVLAILVLTRII
jgi:hypothetical protein